MEIKLVIPESMEEVISLLKQSQKASILSFDKRGKYIKNFDITKCEQVIVTDVPFNSIPKALSDCSWIYKKLTIVVCEKKKEE